jgi:hypothetical protein
MRIFMKRAAIGVAAAALLATTLPAAVFAAGSEPNVVTITPAAGVSFDYTAFPLTLDASSTASLDNAGQALLFDVRTVTPSVCSVAFDLLGADPGHVLYAVTALRTGFCRIQVRDPGNIKFQTAFGERSFMITAFSVEFGLTVTADSQTQMYGVPSSLPIGFSATGFVLNDGPDNAFTTQPTCVTTRGQWDPVGVYLGANTCSGAVAPNYSPPITYVAGDFTVTPKTGVVVTANSYNLTYGDPKPAVGFTVAGLYPGDNFSTNPTCDTPYTKTSPIGTYPTTCSGGILSKNYAAPLFVDGAITVGKATATITADNKSKAYLAPLPALTWTSAPVVAFVDITCSTTATASSVPGSYPITCKQPAKPPSPNSNYNITFVAGKLTIGKGDQDIHLDSVPSTGRVGTFAGLYAHSTAGLPVAFMSDTPATCKTYGAYGTRVYFTGRGDCRIIAWQGGSSIFNPAPAIHFHIWVSRD